MMEFMLKEVTGGMKHRLEVGSFMGDWEGQGAISEMFSWSRRLNNRTW